MDAFLWGTNCNSTQSQYMDELYRLFSASNTHMYGSDDVFSSYHSSSPLAPVAMETHYAPSNSFWSCGLGFGRQRHNSSGSLNSLYSSDDNGYRSTGSTPPISPTLTTGPAMPWNMAASMPIHQPSVPNPWDDFATNGIDCDLDEIDKIMRRNNLDKNVRSSTLGQGRAAELLDANNPAMLMKSRLLLLIREAEKNKKNRRKKNNVCVFCKNNGECEAVYNCHSIKDENNKITCPILYCYKCPKCGSTGDNAHTLKYCPLTTDAYVDAKAVRSTARTAAGKRRFPIP